MAVEEDATLQDAKRRGQGDGLKARRDETIGGEAGDALRDGDVAQGVGAHKGAMTDTCEMWW